jgi:hypothetical protein
LADLLLSGHEGRIPGIQRSEVELILAWMDTNSNYYGTWDYTPHATAGALLQAGPQLADVMVRAGCTKCHAQGHIGNDWINLQRPEWSRILRAPMAKSKDGPGLAMCRNRPARTGYPLVTQRVQPPDGVVASKQPNWDDSGDERVSLPATDDPFYLEMLRIIRATRTEVLARPRIDMPRAEIVGGQCRMQVPPELPLAAPPLAAHVTSGAIVELTWHRTAETIGLQYELHRGTSAGFVPSPSTYLGMTTAGRFIDAEAPAGDVSYALIVTSDGRKGQPASASVRVPDPVPPSPPHGVEAKSFPGEVRLQWDAPCEAGTLFHVLRSTPDGHRTDELTAAPIAGLSYADVSAEPNVHYAYRIQSVDRRAQRSVPSDPIIAAALPLIREPVFAAPLDHDTKASLVKGNSTNGRIRGNAKFDGDALCTDKGGFVQYAARPELVVRHAMTVQCWLRLDEPGQMPVIMACGEYMKSGWFLQRYGRGWRWHVGGVSCDGGSPVVGQWVLLTAIFDGRVSRLYQDGDLVAEVACNPIRTPWIGPLYVGQYNSRAQDAYQVKGKIADIKIYQRALSAGEIKDDCAARKVPTQ